MIESPQNGGGPFFQPIGPPSPDPIPSRYNPQPTPTQPAIPLSTAPAPAPVVPAARTSPFLVDPNTLSAPVDATHPITSAPLIFSPAPVPATGPASPAPTGGSGTSTGTTSTTTSSPVTGSDATGGAADTGLINSLMGLVAAQYAGAGVSGGGTGFDGTVTAPISNDPTGATAAPAQGSSKGILFLVLGIAAAGGLWYWHKHKKGKAA